MKNWKTTVLGVTTIVIAVGGAVVTAIKSGIGSVDWKVTGAAVMGGWGLIHAADASAVK